MSSTKPDIPGRDTGQEQADFVDGETFNAAKLNAIYNYFLTKANDSELFEPNEFQMAIINSLMTVKSLRIVPESSVVDFTTWGKKLDSASPIYGPFSIVAGSVVRDNILNEWDIYLSVIEVPDILISPKPVSPIETPYDDQATMVADQVSQTSGQHYYYTGSTSAWLWNGTSGGVIGDYTEKVEGVDWEESGTKPDYLIVTGTILTGHANLNRIHFILDDDDNGDLKVFATITQKAGANKDPEPPVSGDPLILFDLLMKESSLAGSSPQALVDSSLHAIASSILATGNWSDLAQVANGGYAIGFTSTGSARPYLEIPYAELTDQPLGSNWTIHVGVRLVPGGVFAGLTILSNNNLANGDGFRMYTASADGETAAVWFSLGAVTSYVSADELRSGSSNRIGATWTYITMTYDGTTLRMYYNGVQITSTTALATRPVTSTEPIYVNRRQDSTVAHAGNFEIRRPMIIKKTLTAQEVEDLNTETTNMYNP